VPAVSAWAVSKAKHLCSQNSGAEFPNEIRPRAVLWLMWRLKVIIEESGDATVSKLAQSALRVDLPWSDGGTGFS
jgi:hypothetical protein